jgi:hypothetical protein
MGFASPGDFRTAVCVQCDTQLILTDIPCELRQALGVTDTEIVTFTRLDQGVYRDCVRFENGKIASLQYLKPGILAHVSRLLENSSILSRELETAE